MSGVLASTPVIGAGTKPGEQEWLAAGTYSFIVPAGVTSVAAVAIGPGGGGANTNVGLPGQGGGGGGGALAYHNDIPVTPGETLTITVGQGGRGAQFQSSNGGDGSVSKIARGASNLLLANGGKGGTQYSDTGTGGAGGTGSGITGTVVFNGGKGANNGSGVYANGGFSGSYTAVGINGQTGNPTQNVRNGSNTKGYSGTIGTGSGGQASNSPCADGNAGGVRIIWGQGRSYPDYAWDTTNSFVGTPAATPANFGDAFEGGFYAGMVWQQITQSSTSESAQSSSNGKLRNYAVPDMSVTPLFYYGQQIELRHRANPSVRVAGVVREAKGSTLTVDVTLATGGGPYTDWSVMARARLIVAPKASGENASIAIKNANTSLPAACQTLNDGWAATNAMRDADTSSVYPAAHWARGLTIDGKSDWYIPARDELELCWRNLKPVTNSNYATADRPALATPDYQNNGAYGDTDNTHGTNKNSSPTGAAYTASVPAQTAAAAFKTGGAEAFNFGSESYLSSTEYNATNVWLQRWQTSFPGGQYYGNKSTAFRARAVRRSVF